PSYPSGFRAIPTPSGTAHNVRISCLPQVPAGIGTATTTISGWDVTPRGFRWATTKPTRLRGFLRPPPLGLSGSLHGLGLVTRVRLVGPQDAVGRPFRRPECDLGDDRLRSG